MSPNNEVNSDLMRERQSAKVSTERFAIWWAGSEAALQKQRALEKIFYDDPELEDSMHITHYSNKDHYEYAIKKSTKFIMKMKKWHAEEQRKAEERGEVKTRIESMYDFRMLLAGAPGFGLFPHIFPLRLHFSMFVPSILGQANEEQQKLWLEKAWNMDGWIGTYAQTELGHGTFLRGLQTRADYDIEREEFVLNTPTLESYKWWPGGLGQCANVAIVMAQLYIKGKHYGLHPFLVVIRNENHEPNPGIDIGEIGPKLTGNGTNNGFLGLKNVRIPRMQMFMKNNQVLPNGEFVKGPEPLLTYGSMLFVRVMIVRDSMTTLLYAATIATRYAIVRRQGKIEPNESEVQIMDYLTQQLKIFPQIAKGIYFRIAADYAWVMYREVLEELGAGNRSRLSELHALSCVLKAVCSHDTAMGVDILRRSTGGHGFLSSANFSVLFGNSTASCTYEGENTVLLLQTARFLIKCYAGALNGKVLPKTVSYLQDTKPLRWSDDVIEMLVTALENTAIENTRLAYEHLETKQESSQSLPKAMNLTGIKLTQAASAHGRAFLARIALNEVRGPIMSQPLDVANVLQQLLRIFIMDTFLSNLGEVLIANAKWPVLTAKRVGIIEAMFEEALLEFRPNAIAVVDGFDFHDRTLASTLGCYDGRVYERLMEDALKSPLNQEPVNKTFYTHLKPLLQGKL